LDTKPQLFLLRPLRKINGLATFFGFFINVIGRYVDDMSAKKRVELQVPDSSVDNAAGQ
jgi:hypothetical protein